MSLQTYQKEVAHLGESQGVKDHDHDMIHDLSRRLDALWRYDQYIANAEGYGAVQSFWKKVKQQETANIVELKELLSEHIQLGDF
ncbi:hypothetical protein C1752_07863 [Acaryochloris thomasi RCC1774]|uniref:Ferritin-like diiron domain-containing protein n=1 Tax=Acaryochloris thomasi RCC1774 TaxID=1764569 RepID=A0A2W1JHU0_9CYAN|nr:hypothetical protein [Acaryochloris thomasi]PZD71135.1 hypothetical protein C1752_07863 [Acaryochloris thomasi RCC1774]